MKYWKKYNDEYYNFEDAYALWKKLWEANKFPAIKVHFPNAGKLIFDANNLPDPIDLLSLPLWAIKSDKWQVLIPDDDKNNKFQEIKDWIEYDLKFELDSRFYDPREMDIIDWFQQFDQHILINDDYLEILNFLKESGRLNNWKERKRKYYEE